MLTSCRLIPPTISLKANGVRGSLRSVDVDLARKISS
jgi:hypothetical protein